MKPTHNKKRNSENRPFTLSFHAYCHNMSFLWMDPLFRTFEYHQTDVHKQSIIYGHSTFIGLTTAFSYKATYK